MYLVIGGQISYTPSVERIVGRRTHKTLPFCFSSIMSCLCRKDTRLSPQYIFAFRESLGMRLVKNVTACSLPSKWACPSSLTVTHLIKKAPSFWVTEHMQPPTAIVAAGPSRGCEVPQDSVVLCVIIHHGVEPLAAHVTTPTRTHCLTA